MAGIGLLLSGVTEGAIGLEAAIAVGAALAILWTLVAGLRSVAWTDVGQAVAMLLSSLLAVGFVVAALGGAGAFAAELRAERGAWLDVPGPGLWSLLTFLALSLPWFFFPLSNPQVAQRLFAVRDLVAMRRMILWVLGFGLVFTVVAVVWGLAALLLVPGLEEPATATPALLASGAVPAWVALLLVIGILSAAVSTLDSIALTLGSMVARDLIPRGGAQGAQAEAHQVFVGRVTVVLVVLFASAFALRQTGVVEQLAALSAAGLLVTVPATVRAFFWRGGTAWGACASIAGGAATAVGLVGLGGVGVFDPLLPLSVAGASAALFVGVSLATAPRPEALDFPAELRGALDRLGARPGRMARSMARNMAGRSSDLHRRAGPGVTGPTRRPSGRPA